MSYNDLKTENLGANRHLKFQGRWISTIVQPSGTHNETKHQISAKCDNPQLRNFRGKFVDPSSPGLGSIQTKFGMIIEPPNTLYKFVSRI